MDTNATSQPDIDAIAARLRASQNVREIRAGTDLDELLAHARRTWRGRFRVRRAGTADDGSLALVCDLCAAGLIWSTGQPSRHEQFALVLSIPGAYPLSQPAVQFLEPVPFCGHVVHKQFVPDTASLPARLQVYLREGHGRTCYLRTAQWVADTGTLAVVLWQVSRILTMAKGWAEPISLNPAARDHALRLGRQKDSLPLGPPLPCPIGSQSDEPQAVCVGAPGCDLENDDVDWNEPEAQQDRDES